MALAGLFAGIGGFEIAFEMEGFEPGLLVEVDPPALKVLRERFPGADIQEDVLKLPDLPSDTEILTAGFPCQNLSMAGDKVGIGGAKSGVVQRMFELIERSRVPLIVIENVYFMLHLDSGRAMEWLVDRFEALGYRWAYRVLDSMGFGLPQRRRRVYFVASLDLDPRSVLFADEEPRRLSVQPSLERPLGFYWTEGRTGIGLTVDGIPPLKVGSSVGIPSAPAVLFPDGEVLMPSLAACERLQGFSDGWTAAARPEGKEREPRWRLIGNAISVPVAQWVASRVKTPGDILSFDIAEMRTKGAWPDAAWNVDAGRTTVSASDKPISCAHSPISEYRSADWNRLSARALSGFISRLREGGLKVPSGFLAALESATRKSPEPPTAGLFASTAVVTH